MQKWEYRFVSIEIDADDRYHFLINSKRYGNGLTHLQVDGRRWQVAEQLGTRDGSLYLPVTLTRI